MIHADPVSVLFITRAKEKATKKDEASLTQAAITIQAWVRRFLAQRARTRLVIEAFDKFIQANQATESSSDDPSCTGGSATNLDLFRETGRLLTFYKPKRDGRRLHSLTLFLLDSLTTLAPAKSYAALVLVKTHIGPWVQQVKALVTLLLERLALGAAATDKEEAKAAASYLHLLITLTDSKAWRLCEGLSDKEGPARALALTLFEKNIVAHAIDQAGLYRCLGALLTAHLAVAKPAISPATLAAVMTLVLRPVLPAAAKAELLFAFGLHILSTPGLGSLLASACPAVKAVMDKERVVPRCLKALGDSQQTIKIVFNTLEGNATLCLIGNIVQMIPMSELQGSADLLETFVSVCTQLTGHCRSYVTKKETSMVSDHIIFGWFSGATPKGLHDALPRVLAQIRALWTPAYIRFLFSELWTETERINALVPNEDAKQKSSLKSLLKPKAARPMVDALVSMRVLAVTQLYITLIATIKNAKAEVLGALAFLPELTPRLWRFMQFLGPKGSMVIYLQAAGAPGRLETEPLLPILTLTCDMTVYLLTVLDDEEVYEKQEPFSVELLAYVASFLNHFVFALVWQPSDDQADTLRQDLLSSCGKLLRMLRDMDGRRALTSPDAWFLKELPQALFQEELQREVRLRRAGTPAAYDKAHAILTRMPHVVDFKARVALFRDEVKRDREAILGDIDSHRPKPRVTIRRGHLLTDGFREFRKLPVAQLKDEVKIHFVNELGLDEVGIDEKGVFKEFLEQTIKEAFDPSFGLFGTTSENRIYPSSNSGVHPEHLELFEFVGRLLGKMLYDGIVVDIPFAHFFLNTLLGRRNTLDELPTLDAALSKNLSYIKHYEGDMLDLALCFAVDDEVFGERVTAALMPGGSGIDVTNENKILYVHLMADYRLNKQLRKQTDAFIKGFRAVVSPQWLRYFSAPELQRLISGDDVRLDVEDLRAHCNYIGGYHNSHRVIKWLWEVVGEDFTQKEQELFLKFVTSCSKPPILGFASLRPAFSIRAVQEGDSEDSYTLGSAIANFFSRGSDTTRLPTSSTCFNLLKLPMYKSKKVLREKLKYAINSGAGFELS